MKDFFSLAKCYPEIFGIVISLISGFLGWFFREIFQLFVESKKYKRELKTYFWKEKINAAKKASEFYLEYKNLLNLMQIQFGLFESGKINYSEFTDKIGFEIEQLSQRLKKFPHLEYHHINLFYEFNESKSLQLSNEINDLLKTLLDLNIEDTEFKVKAKRTFTEIKGKYLQLGEIINGYLDKVRNDIKDYI